MKMKTIRAWSSRLRNLLRREQLERELHEELASHLAMHIEDNLRAGMTPEEARRDALMKLGGVEQAKEDYRDRCGVSWLETLLQDLRFGTRMLRRSPGFTAIAALTLALGIGANTAIFSLVNGILLHPLPYAGPDALVSVTGTYPKGAFVAMRQQIRSMEVAAYSDSHEVNLTGYGEPVRLNSALVSAELFSMLLARPALGRTFYPGEDISGQDNFVILSEALWREHFGSNPSIIGRSIELGGVSRQVVGVMPADFRFPSTKTRLWLPLHNDPGDTVAFWAGDFMPVIGRLRPGSTIQQARAEIQLFQSQVFKLFPWTMPAAWNAGVSVVPLQGDMVADVRTRLLMLLGAVMLVLLIACANVANLTLSRGITREKEMALRATLGAGRGRIVMQLLTENILLALLGGVLGLALAAVGLSLLKSLLPAGTPRLAEVQMDWRVLAFTGGLAILTGLAFGLAPALRASRAALSESLRSGGRGAAASVSQRLRGAFVIAEVAFAMLLVIAAGLLIRSFWAISHVNPGFRSENVMTARITPNESFCNDAARCLTLYREVLDQVLALPGVSGAALVNSLPLGGRVAKRSLQVENYVVPSGAATPLFWLDIVTPGYFQTMGIPVLEGRSFSEADSSGNPRVAVVTVATARRYWPTQSAVGKHIRLLGDNDWHTIVGVIPDMRAYDLQRNVPAWIEGTAFVPYSPNATLEDKRVPAEMTIAVKTSMDEASATTMLRRIINGLQQGVPISEVKSMRVVVSEAASTPASTTSLFIIFAGLALLLGVIGIYGVLAFLVSRRTREIGIRVALGAQPREVMWLVMKEGAKFSVAGIALGLAGAFVASRLLATELYGVGPLDPVTYVGVAVLMAVVTMMACYIPTRRALKIDPLVALRYE